jgi:hypothetical protein
LSFHLPQLQFDWLQIAWDWELIDGWKVLVCPRQSTLTDTVRGRHALEALITTDRVSTPLLFLIRQQGTFSMRVIS